MAETVSATAQPRGSQRMQTKRTEAVLLLTQRVGSVDFAMNDLASRHNAVKLTFPSCIVVSTHVAPLDEQSIGQLRRSSAILSVALATPKLDSTTRFGIFWAHLRLTRWPNCIKSVGRREAVGGQRIACDTSACLPKRIAKKTASSAPYRCRVL